MVTGVSSEVAAVSSDATGAGLATLKVTVWVTVPPLPSDAVMVTVYTPPLTWLAAGSMVPVIRPVSGSMLRPAGSPVAAKLRSSPSMSEK